MGLVVVVVVLAFAALLVALFLGAVRTSERPRSHGWLVVLPLIAALGWILGEAFIGH